MLCSDNKLEIGANCGFIFVTIVNDACFQRCTLSIVDRRWTESRKVNSMPLVYVLLKIYFFFLFNPMATIHVVFFLLSSFWTLFFHREIAFNSQFWNSQKKPLVCQPKINFNYICFFFFCWLIGSKKLPLKSTFK